jgi:hypothetical protein
VRVVLGASLSLMGFVPCGNLSLSFEILCPLFFPWSQIRLNGSAFLLCSFGYCHLFACCIVGLRFCGLAPVPLRRPSHSLSSSVSLVLRRRLALDSAPLARFHLLGPWWGLLCCIVSVSSLRPCDLDSALCLLVLGSAHSWPNYVCPLSCLELSAGLLSISFHSNSLLECLLSIWSNCPFTVLSSTASLFPRRFRFSFPRLANSWCSMGLTLSHHRFPTSSTSTAWQLDHYGDFSLVTITLQKILGLEWHFPIRVRVVARRISS